MIPLTLRPGVTGELWQLPNRLTVVLVRNPRAPSVSVIHWVKGGSMHEHRRSPDGRGITGIAHLFEHMMFRPLAPGQPTFDERVQKLGAKINANTRNSATVYTSSVGAENLYPLLQAEVDRFQHLRVSDDLLDVERKAVESEYQVNHDSNPTYDLWETLTRAAFPHHPLEWGVSGFREDLYTIRAEDCNAFFERVYRPNNVGLFIAGPIDLVQTKAWVDELYGSWAAGEDTVLPPFPAPASASVSVTGSVPSQSNMFWVGFRIPYASSSDHARDLAHYILFDASYSLARRSLLDRHRWISTLSSVNYSYDTAMLKLVVVPMPHVREETILDGIQSLIDDLKALSDEEFNAYKAHYLMDAKEGCLRNSNLADLLAFSWGKHGDVQYALDILDERVTLTKDDVVAAIAPWITPNNRIVARPPAPKAAPGLAQPLSPSHP